MTNTTPRPTADPDASSAPPARVILVAPNAGSGDYSWKATPWISPDGVKAPTISWRAERV